MNRCRESGPMNVMQTSATKKYQRGRKAEGIGFKPFKSFNRFVSFKSSTDNNITNTQSSIAQTCNCR
jgi:hypothetical protein